MMFNKSIVYCKIIKREGGVQTPLNSPPPLIQPQCGYEKGGFALQYFNYDIVKYVQTVQLEL